VGKGKNNIDVLVFGGKKQYMEYFWWENWTTSSFWREPSNRKKKLYLQISR
jgi:hypothetical protein